MTRDERNLRERRKEREREREKEKEREKRKLHSFLLTGHTPGERGRK